MRSKLVWERCALGFGLLTLGGVAAAGCAGDSESTTAAPVKTPTALLRASFPDQAERVLGAGQLEATERGFGAASRTLSADLPRDGADAVRLRFADGWEVQVREEGATGPGTPVERAVSYQRAGGTSYWTALAGGLEEWLHLEAGAAARGGVAASWHVEGAKVEQHGNAVALFDTKGKARLWVTAPAAYAGGGKAIGVHLSVRGSRIEVSVDPTPDEVLIDPSWITTAPMAYQRSSHRTVLLNNGKALAIGGSQLYTTHATTEAYDVYANTWTTKASMATGRLRHTATLLSDGRVLVTGGSDTNLSTAYASTELYDPTTDTWTAGPSLATGRYSHQAVALTDGRVLVVGGQTSWSGRLASAELYDPTTNTWSAAGSMTDARIEFALTRLADGRPMAMGGFGLYLNTTAEKGAEIYDPSTNTWSQAANMNRSRYYFTAELLQSGKVLAASGDMNSYIGASEVYDPATNTWTNTGQQAGVMNIPRIFNATAVLNDGRVVLVGRGYNANPDTSELYDPATNSWSADPMLAYRVDATATLMPDGEVLAAGGNFSSDPNTERYTPAAANGTACTSAGQCASGRCVEGVCCSTCEGSSSTSCQACTVASGAPADGACTQIYTGTCALSNGWSCTSDSMCASGHCVDGVCCNTACGGGSTTDCQVCSYYLGASNHGTCTTLTTGSTCGSALGAACTSGIYCQSGNCVDGVCCNTACGGGSTTDCLVCSAAAGASANGTCTTLTTGSTCGLANGTACTFAGACLSGNCVDGVCCDTACGGGSLTDCQVCSTGMGASANGTCTTITTGSTCGAANGTSCSSGSTCQSGNCVDGVCCNTACGGGSTTDCQACSTAAGATTNGTCATLTTGSCGTTDTCITIQRGTSGTVNEAHVNSSSAGTNYGANATLSIGSSGSGNTRYGLLRFDLSAIPSTATITTATLTLTTFSGGGVNVRAHRITSSWAESTVTWTSFASAFNSTVELTMSGSTSYTGSLATLVQSWVNGTYSNYGVALERDLTATTIFDASEWSTTADRPKLYVCYH